MYMKYFYKFIFLAFLCASHFACKVSDQGAPSGSSPSEEPVVGADKSPYVNFLRKFKTTDSITINNIADFNKKYYFAGSSSVWFEKQLQHASYLPSLIDFESEIEKKGSPEITDWLLKAYPRKKKPDILFDVGSKFALVLAPTKRENSYQVTSYFDVQTKSTYSVKLIHYSMSPDKSRFSLTLKLPTYTAQVNDPVVTLYFSLYNISSSQSDFPHVDTRNGELVYFVEGNNKVYRLEKSKQVNFRLCFPQDENSQVAQKISHAIQKATQDWQEVLNNKLSLKYLGISTDCEPPGNVNTGHSLYALFDKSINTRGPALTLIGGLDLVNKTFLTGLSQILFFIPWRSGMEFESNQAGLTGKNVIRHEIGHVLGLGHKENVPATMSHRSPAQTLTDYDKKAVLELYK